MKGCIHIYTGEGKGKTTAATGLATRAAGQNLRVGFFQFLKSGLSGEAVALAKLGVTVVSPLGKEKFTWAMDDKEKEECREIQQKTFARAAVMAYQVDLLVLDELNSALHMGMLDKDEVIQFVKNKPETLELVLTGRNADEDLIALADYVTEMRMIAHPFAGGLKARRGIEF